MAEHCKSWRLSERQITHEMGLVYMFDARAKTLPYYLVNWTVRVRVMW